MSLTDFAADYFVVNRIGAERQTFVLRALRQLELHAGQPPIACDDGDLRAFLGSLLSGGLSPNTVRKYNHAIKPYFHWAWQRRRIDDGRWLRIKEVANPRGATGDAKPRPYKRTEVKQFWVDLDATYPLVPNGRLRRWDVGVARYGHYIWLHAMHLQTQAIASLALYGGLRRTEIRVLSIDDMHPDNDFIVVRGKTEIHDEPKLREVPYTVDGREHVAAWLDFRARILRLEPPPVAHTEPWLVLNPRATANNTFPSHPSNPIGTGTFNALLSRVGQGYELHRLRHTCATEWLRQGVELERVRDLLGHADIEQTLQYAKLIKDDVARSLRKHEAGFTTAVGRDAA